MPNVYKWTPNYQGKGSAQTAGEVCAELEAKGCLTAQNLVDVSRPEEAPLHNMFEWRDPVAAEAYRRVQARNIIHSIVTIEDDGNPQKVFHRIEASEEQGYLSIQTIIKSEETYDLLLKQAYRDMRSFKMRYERIAALEPVVTQMSILLDEEP